MEVKKILLIVVAMLTFSTVWSNRNRPAAPISCDTGNLIVNGNFQDTTGGTVNSCTPVANNNCPYNNEYLTFPGDVIPGGWNLGSSSYVESSPTSSSNYFGAGDLGQSFNIANVPYDLICTAQLTYVDITGYLIIEIIGSTLIALYAPSTPPSNGQIVSLGFTIPKNSPQTIDLYAIGSFDDVSVSCTCSCASNGFLVLKPQSSYSAAEEACTAPAINTRLADVVAGNINQIPTAFVNCGLSGTSSIGWIGSWNSVPYNNLGIEGTAIAVWAANYEYYPVCNLPPPPIPPLPTPVGSSALFYLYSVEVPYYTAISICSNNHGLAAINSINKAEALSLMSTYGVTAAWIYSWNGDYYGDNCNAFYQSSGAVTSFSPGPGCYTPLPVLCQK